ncbi:zinc finger protein 862-like [Branchiostoma floridae x Branchiostoma belcheri]
MKTCIAANFMDKSYLSLYEVMLTKEPYCLDFQNILHLVQIMLVMPVSSAQCERGFSAQRRLKSDARASLSTKTVEDLIRITVEGPSLESFDPLTAIQKWLHSGQRPRRPTYQSAWPND